MYAASTSSVKQRLAVLQSYKIFFDALLHHCIYSEEYWHQSFPLLVSQQWSQLLAVQMLTRFPCDYIMIIACITCPLAGGEFLCCMLVLPFVITPDHMSCTTAGSCFPLNHFTFHSLHNSLLGKASTGKVCVPGVLAKLWQ